MSGGFMDQKWNWSQEEEDERFWADAEQTWTREELARSRQDGLVLLLGLADDPQRVFAEHDRDEAKQ